MLKIKVWLEDGKDLWCEEIRHKRPNKYMYAWSFKKLLNYIKEELYWQDIDESQITAIVLEDNYSYVEIGRD